MRATKARAGVVAVVIGVLISCADPLPATVEEVFWGAYRHKSAEHDITFEWDVHGISNLRINGHQHPKEGVSVDTQGYGPFVIHVPREGGGYHVFLLQPHMPRPREIESVSGFLAEVIPDGTVSVPSVVSFTFRKFTSKELRGRKS